MKLPLLTLAAITTLALACTSDEPLATPSPSPTPTPELTATPTLLSPTPSPTPTKTPTASATPVDRTRSLKAVDQVISAVEAGDVDALESLVTYTNVTCKPGTALVAIPYPSCGSPPSRLVPAFPAGVCAYVWHAKPRPMLEHFVERAGPLFAVIEGPAYLVDFGIVGASPGSPGDYRIVFSSQPGDDIVGATAVIEHGGLTALWFGCRRPVDLLYQEIEPAPVIIQRGPAFVEPEPALTPEPIPDPNLAPQGTRTGIAVVDWVMLAIESRDPAAVYAVLHPRRMQCSYLNMDIAGPPECRDGELEATVVDAFLLAGCEGSWARPDLAQIASDLADETLTLYLAAKDDRSPYWPHQLLYVAGPDEPAFLFLLDDKGVSGFARLGCSTPAEWASWSHIILRGPAWPEDAAP